MFTTTCPKCKQATTPVYKNENELPFDWGAGFFCQHCSLERLDTDSMFADLIAKVNILEETLGTSKRNTQKAFDDIRKKMPRRKPVGNFGLLD